MAHIGLRVELSTGGLYRYIVDSPQARKPKS